MTEPAVANDILEAAWSLAKGGKPAEALAAIQQIAADESRFSQAQHLRGFVAARQGDLKASLAFLTDAVAGEAGATLAWQHFASVAVALDLPDDAVSMLGAYVARTSIPELNALSEHLLRSAAFTDKKHTPRKDAVFSRLLIPILSELLRRRAMDSALALEGRLYEFHVKSTETEAHFATCMTQIEPLFTQAGQAWRRELEPLPSPSLDAPYKVGFFIHNASMLAHIEVLLNTLKGLRLLDEQPFEPTVYCFGGRSPPLEDALARLSVRLVMLNERFPETKTSGWRRLLRFRELLSEDGVQELVWVSLVTMLPLAFGMRLAPVQTWWAMKYRNFSQEDIDGYVTGSALTRYGAMCGRVWRMGRLGVDDWYDPAHEAQAASIRASLAGRTIVMTLARTEKMHDPAYLAAMTRILVEHPDAVFLWAGREESSDVTEAFRAAGVLDRTRFIGWVDTRLYAQVADVFLDTFPFPCGFTLFQAMAAGKAVVLYDSPEAAQTGLWNFLKPLIDGDDGTPEERAELRSIIGDATNPLVPVARSPDEYVRYAGRVIGDPEVRAAAGAASRRFMANYCSDPRAMGSSLASHFVELIQERRAALSA